MKHFIKNKLCRAALAVLLLGACIFCTGCTSEIALELKKDGSVTVDFNGTAGDAFAALINAAMGSNTNASSQNLVFNTEEIEYEMSQNGFTDVKAVSKNGRGLSVSMTDKNGKSALFTSGVVSTNNGKLQISRSLVRISSRISRISSSWTQLPPFLMQEKQPVQYSMCLSTTWMIWSF